MLEQAIYAENTPLILAVAPGSPLRLVGSAGGDASATHTVAPGVSSLEDLIAGAGRRRVGADLGAWKPRRAGAHVLRRAVFVTAVGGRL